MLGQRAVCRPRYDLLARFASFLGHLGIKPLSQMAATIRNNLKELPVSLGQLGHPDWDKQVIVRGQRPRGGRANKIENGGWW